MENLNAEQIIKDLECCKFGKDEAKCKECNWHPWIKPLCWRLLASNTLALIKSQEQRIKELAEENERLRKNIQPPIQRNIDILKATTKADTVRKMQELIEEKADSCEIIPLNSIRPIDTIYQISKTQLDQIAKEIEDED